MMKSLGLKYNIYLTIGEIGTNPEYLTWDIVRKIHSEGIVGFGAAIGQSVIYVIYTMVNILLIIYIYRVNKNAKYDGK